MNSEQQYKELLKAYTKEALASMIKGISPLQRKVLTH